MSTLQQVREWSKAEALHPELRQVLLSAATALEESERSFALRWEADTRGIAKWRAAGYERELSQPDHADLVCWLLQEVARLERDYGVAMGIALERTGRCTQLSLALETVTKEKIKSDEKLQEAMDYGNDQTGELARVRGLAADAIKALDSGFNGLAEASHLLDRVD